MENKDYKKLIAVRKCEFAEDNGLVTVIFHKPLNRIDKILDRFIKPKPSKVDLDEIGSFIWNQIDGKHNVEEIINIASAHFGEKIHPAEERTILFFQQMSKTKLISLYQKIDGSN